MKTIISLLALVASTSFSFAQTNAAQNTINNLCYLAGDEYSTGATIRASDKVMICAAGGKWEYTDKLPAGCLKSGKLSAFGTTVRLKVVEIIYRCKEDGTWDAKKRRK